MVLLPWLHNGRCGMPLTKRTLVLLIAPVAVLLLAMDACDGVASVTINEGDTTLVVGETRALTVTVITRGGADRAVRWSSSDPDVATVNQTGSVTGVTEGVTRISVVSVADASKRDTVTVTVTASEVTPTAEVRTSKGVYDLYEDVRVTFSGFPGNRHEWITIVPATAPDDEIGEKFFTDGARAGEITFRGFPPGDYEVRAYFDSPDAGFVVRHRHSFEVVGTTDDGWVDPAVVARAMQALIDGASEVDLSEDGRLTYRVEAEGHDEVREELRKDGRLVAWWQHSATTGQSAFDVNVNGRFDEETTVTYTTADQWEEVATRWSTATERTIAERRTYRRDGERIHVLVERPDETGALVVVEAYVASVVQPLGPGDRVRHGRDSACTEEQREQLARLWDEAVTRGLACLSRHGAFSEFAKLYRLYMLRPVEFICTEERFEGDEEDGPVSPAWTKTYHWLADYIEGHLSLWPAPIRIWLKLPEFFEPQHTDLDRAGALFHELLHHILGPHDPDLDEGRPSWSDKARADRIYAWQLLCFGDAENRLAYCEVATASGSYGDDLECNDFCNRYAAGGSYCPCEANKAAFGWHPTEAACAARCPSGLKCFNVRCVSREEQCKR